LLVILIHFVHLINARNMGRIKQHMPWNRSTCEICRLVIKIENIGTKWRLVVTSGEGRNPLIFAPF
jgi:hypothetical protein